MPFTLLHCHSDFYFNHLLPYSPASLRYRYWILEISARLDVTGVERILTLSWYSNQEETSLSVTCAIMQMMFHRNISVQQLPRVLDLTESKGRS